MSKRHAIPHRKSKRSFTKHAMGHHPKNNLNPMRGGIRA